VPGLALVRSSPAVLLLLSAPWPEHCFDGAMMLQDSEIKDSAQPCQAALRHGWQESAMSPNPWGWVEKLAAIRTVFLDAENWE
jgi:hypothetical protein